MVDQLRYRAQHGVLELLPALVGAAIPVLLALCTVQAFVAFSARSIAMFFAALAGGLAPRARDRHHWLRFKVDVRVIGRTRHGQAVTLARYVGLIEGEARVKAGRPEVALSHMDELRVAAPDGDAILVAVAENAVCLAAPRLHLGSGVAPNAGAPLGGAVADAVRACRTGLAARGVVVVLVAVDALFRPKPRRGRQRGRQRGRTRGWRPPGRWRRRGRRARWRRCWRGRRWRRGRRRR